MQYITGNDTHVAYFTRLKVFWGQRTGCALLVLISLSQARHNNGPRCQFSGDDTVILFTPCIILLIWLLSSPCSTQILRGHICFLDQGGRGETGNITVQLSLVNHAKSCIQATSRDSQSGMFETGSVALLPGFEHQSNCVLVVWLCQIIYPICSSLFPCVKWR